jgi:hypothetical protein
MLLSLVPFAIDATLSIIDLIFAHSDEVNDQDKSAMSDDVERVIGSKKSPETLSD